MDYATNTRANEEAALENFLEKNGKYPGTHTFISISPKHLECFRAKFLGLKFEPSVGGECTSVTII